MDIEHSTSPNAPDAAAIRRFFGPNTALRLGGFSFLASFLLAIVCTAAVVGLGPSLNFVFGIGWFVPVLVAFVLFLGLLFLKNWIWEPFFARSAPEGEAELIEYLVRENYTGHSDEEIETELLENALHLKRVKIRECMTPRSEIVHVDVRASIADLRNLFVESKLSRILVTDGDLDKVLGYVHVQQLFERPRRVRDMVLPSTFVPQAMGVDDLLQKFIRARSSIACVVDEYGGTAGLVTLEDALEQLFGNIDDEHDQAEFIETMVGPGEYLFSGRLEVAYLNEKYPELALPEGDYQTLSGLLVAEAENIPGQGSRMDIGSTIFIVELVSERKIETVRVKI